MSTKIETRQTALIEVQRLLSKSDFTKADSARCEYLLRLSSELNPAINELRKIRMAEISSEAGLIDPAHAAQYRLTPGVTGLSRTEQNFMTALRFGRDQVPEEYRALDVAVGSQGGYLVAQNFGDRVWLAMKLYDNLFDAATVITTDTGNAPLPWPMIDDTAGVATKVGENVQVSPSDVASFSQLSLGTPDTWRTNMQQVSMELSADSAFDLGGFLADVFGTRLARGIAPDFVSTLTAGAALGKTGTTGQTTTVTYDDLCDLLGSIDPTYVASPKFAWLMRFSTLVSIMKLKGSTAGQPMLAFDANRWMLFGKPIYICPSVPAMAANAKSILAGDMSRFVIRRVRDSIEVKRFGETYAEYGMLAFQGFMRVKAGLAKPTGSDSPIKWYANSAT